MRPDTLGHTELVARKMVDGQRGEGVRGGGKEGSRDGPTRGRMSGAHDKRPLGGDGLIDGLAAQNEQLGVGRLYAYASLYGMCAYIPGRPHYFLLTTNY